MLMQENWLRLIQKLISHASRLIDPKSWSLLRFFFICNFCRIWRTLWQVHCDNHSDYKVFSRQEFDWRNDLLLLFFEIFIDFIDPLLQFTLCCCSFFCSSATWDFFSADCWICWESDKLILQCFRKVDYLLQSSKHSSQLQFSKFFFSRKFHLCCNFFSNWFLQIPESVNFFESISAAICFWNLLLISQQPTRIRLELWFAAAIFWIFFNNLRLLQIIAFWSCDLLELWLASAVALFFNF